MLYEVITDPVPDHLRVDATAFLGAGHPPAPRLRRRRHPDAAGDARRAVHPLAHTVLHDPAGAGDHP